MAGKAAPEGVKQLSGTGANQPHSEFENDGGVSRTNAPKEETETKKVEVQDKKEEKPLKEKKQEEKQKPVILEIT